MHSLYIHTLRGVNSSSSGKHFFTLHVTYMTSLQYQFGRDAMVNKHIGTGKCTQFYETLFPYIYHPLWGVTEAPWGTVFSLRDIYGLGLQYNLGCNS